jgi:purine-binding chemotaxis protein CheW
MTSLHVIFRVGASDYALPVSQVLHLESFTAATRVPGAPGWVLGLVQSRGRMVPVVDLRARFGEPEGAPEVGRRVIVAEHGRRAVGLLVDSAREVAALSDEQFEEPPEMLSRQAAGFTKAVGRAGARIVFALDLPKVLGEGGKDGG